MSKGEEKREPNGNKQKEIPNYAASMKNFCSEETILQMLGIKKAVLDNLRTTQKFPYIKVNQNFRLYHLGSVQDWLLSRQIPRTEQRYFEGGV